MPMSPTISEVSDLYRAEMALGHAWEALERAHDAMPLLGKHPGVYGFTATELHYMAMLVYCQREAIHDLLMELHGGEHEDPRKS